MDDANNRPDIGYDPSLLRDCEAVEFVLGARSMRVEGHRGCISEQLLDNVLDVRKRRLVGQSGKSVGTNDSLDLRISAPLNMKRE